MEYRKCGNSGIYLPAVSLGMWQNFGSVDPYDRAKEMVCYAFDRGITHFDLANNYGPEVGSAETTFGKIFSEELSAHRDEMIVSTKAGHEMWKGPYGDGGSRKYLMASLNQSLRRMGLEYVDIFYSHRYVTTSPLDETLQALVDIVKQGKALYVALSKYPPEQTRYAIEFMAQQHVRCLVHQDKYSMLVRGVESTLFPLLEEQGLGFVAFSPLAQGLLTNRYLNGIPDGSRASRGSFLKADQITPQLLQLIRSLNAVAVERGESLSQLALLWTLRHSLVASTIIGASSVHQIEENLCVLESAPLSEEHKNRIEALLRQYEQAK